MFQRTAILFLLTVTFLLGGKTYAFAQMSSSTGRIVVKVIAFRSSKGSIHLSLYNQRSARKFPDVDVRESLRIVPVKNSSVTEVVFDNVPYGTYAIAGLHDENNSGDMDYNFVGLPKEGYCFSNDAKPVLAPPSFGKAKFNLNQKQKVLYVAMQY